MGAALWAALVLALLTVPPNLAEAASVGQWTSTTSYPLKVAGDSCVVNSNIIYCVGGFDASGNDYSKTYYATLSASGIGTWTSTTPYPAEIDSSGCAVWSSTIYCVGGENSTSVLSSVYSAPLSASGIGAWTAVAAYPQTIAASACFTNDDIMYCVGGFDLTGDETAAAYYSPLSSGLTSWTSTTAYPYAVNSEGCLVQDDTVYCVAGNEESGLPQYPVDNVYYAQLSSSGIGPWFQTTAYPKALSSLSCVLYSGSIYCAGGFNLDEISSDNVYVGTISSSGISGWTNSTAYPNPFDVSSCVMDYSSMYCVAGRTFLGGSKLTMSSNAFFATLGGTAVTSSSTSSATSSTSTTPTTSSTTTSSTIFTSTTTTPVSSTSSTVSEFNSGAILVVMLASMLAVSVLARRSADKG